MEPPAPSQAVTAGPSAPYLLHTTQGGGLPPGLPMFGPPGWFWPRLWCLRWALVGGLGGQNHPKVRKSPKIPQNDPQSDWG